MMYTTADIAILQEYLRLGREIDWSASYYTASTLEAKKKRMAEIKAAAHAQAVAYWEEAVRLASQNEYISLVGQPDELMRIAVAEGLRRAVEEGEISTVYPAVCRPKRRTGRIHEDGSPEYSNETRPADSCRAVGVGGGGCGASTAGNRSTNRTTPCGEAPFRDRQCAGVVWGEGWPWGKG